MNEWWAHQCTVVWNFWLHLSACDGVTSGLWSLAAYGLLEDFRRDRVTHVIDFQVRLYVRSDACLSSRVYRPRISPFKSSLRFLLWLCHRPLLLNETWNLHLCSDKLMNWLIDPVMTGVWARWFDLWSLEWYEHCSQFTHTPWACLSTLSLISRQTDQ